MPELATTVIVDEATGEVRSAADEAAAYAESARRVAELEQEARDVRALLDEARIWEGIYRERLITIMKPGQAIGDVVCVHGKRRNATVNRDGISEHREQLVDLGLLEITFPPLPEPVLKPATVSAIRSAEADLARRGIPLADLVVEGGAGEPVLEVRPEAPPTRS
jgi:hypothetical protein